MSKMTADGELVIYGCDEAGKQLFSYTLQTHDIASQGNQDAEDEA